MAIWRQVAERLRADIAQELADPDGRLPPETALAARFGVNRHTVRAAIAALVREGVLRAEQGRGTFVEKSARLAFPIGARTKFTSEPAGNSHSDKRGILVEKMYEDASAEVAKALGVAIGAPVIRLETLAEVEGRPVSRASNWFDATRFGRMGNLYALNGSISRSFGALGVDDYFRRTTTVTARHADAADLRDLQLAPGAIVLVAVAVNVDAEGNPVQHAQTRFAADRVELQILDEPDPHRALTRK